MKKVLILNGQYFPGYKGGGPIQSCINMVENLSDFFEFYVLCADRDYKCDKPYNYIKINQWNVVGAAKVFYMSPELQNISGFVKVLTETDFDILYLNGFFSPIFTIKPLIARRLGKLKNCKVILTPRGDFTGGCENKKTKKYSYLYLSKLVGLYHNLLWHATSKLEEIDIRKKFPHASTLVIPNLPSKFVPKIPAIEKNPGELRLVFVSRIFPKKNLKFALEVLKEIKKGKIIFEIYGPMEDCGYWSDCEKVISQLPENVVVSYKGEVSHNEVPHIFEQYHAFLFPTLGENYGHVIVEAMMNNCICILSKGVTPWDDYCALLNLGATLANKNEFVKSIEYLLGWNNENFIENIEKNNRYIESKIDSKENVEKYMALLGYRGETNI